MKKIISLFIALIFSSCFVLAQEVNDTTSNVVYIDIPQKMKINDKIILENLSPYTILQAVVVLIDPNASTSLGSCLLVSPGSKREMASFDDNGLRKIRGKQIGVKIKGVKKILGDTQTTQVNGGGLGVDVNHTELKADDLNSIDQSLITYDFRVDIREEDHDLYIKATQGSAKSAFDF